MSAQLLAMGWSHEKVRERHLLAARNLVNAGVQWRGAEAADRPHVAALVREHIAGMTRDWVMDEDSGAVVAADVDGRIIAALVVTAVQFDDNLVAIVRSEVVEPDWRGKGVGSVTLGVLPQMLTQHDPPGRAPNWTIGNCEPAAARYYQRLGFTVLQPGEALALPFNAHLPAGLSSAHYPCWIFRAF